MESRIGPFGVRAPGRDGRAAEIKGWAARAFGLDEGTTVTVAELRCTEPGCPPVETVIGILGGGEARRFKLHKPISGVTFEDVEWLAASGSGIGEGAGETGGEIS